MKINVKKTIVTLMYCLVYLASLLYLRYSVHYNVTLRRLYQIVLIIIVASSILYVFTNSVSKQTAYIDSFALLLLLMMFYETLILAWYGFSRIITFIVDGVTWPCVFLVFYDYSKEYELPSSFHIITKIGMFAVCLFSVPNIVDRYFHYETTGGAIFATYFCIAFLPMVLYLYKEKISAIYSFIVAVLMLFSSKRAAFVIIIIGFVVYLFTKYTIEGSLREKIRKILLYLLALTFVVLVGQYLIAKFNLNILSRMANSFEDQGSKRTVIWEFVYQSYRSSSVLKRIFGHGFHAVYYQLTPGGFMRFSHNSYLEFLYDFGIIGLAFIVLFVVRLIRETIILTKCKSNLAPVMNFSLIPMIVLSLLSYFFEQSLMIVPFCIIWGICLGGQKRKN